jgi:PIN domain nuclease of toxin-antitoxin system
VLEANKLSRDQSRLLDQCVRRSEPVALSCSSLLEIATLESQGKIKLKLNEFFEELQGNPIFRLLPLTYEIAAEVSSLGTVLRDPADRVIVASARVHKLRLLTSDQRIVESRMVATVD